MFGHLGPVCILLECMSHLNPLWDIKDYYKAFGLIRIMLMLGISGHSGIFRIFGLSLVIRRCIILFPKILGIWVPFEFLGKERWRRREPVVALPQGWVRCRRHPPVPQYTSAIQVHPLRMSPSSVVGSPI